MEQRELGKGGPTGLGDRPGLHGDVRLLRPGRRGARASRRSTRRSTAASPCSTPATSTAWATTRCSIRRAIEGRRDRVFISVKFGALRTPGRAVHRLRRPAGGREELRELQPAAAGHRLHRPVPAGPARPVGADRGDRRRDRRAGEGRVRPAHRRVGDVGGDGAAGARRPPDRGAGDRVRRAHPRHRGRDPAGPPRAGHLGRRLRRALARADRHAAGPVRHAGRLAQHATSPGSRARTSTRTSRWSTPWPRSRPRRARRPRSSPSPGCWRRATTSCPWSAPGAAIACARPSARSTSA